MTEREGTESWPPTMPEMFQLYKQCVVRITTKNEHGDLANGSGFHIGDGYIVTARHVVENRPIVEIVGEGYPTEVTCRGIVYPKDPRIDLAVLQTDFSLERFIKLTTTMRDDGREAPKTDHIPLGGHLDDWLGDELVLSKALVMGFPPVPTSIAPFLVACEAEVNAIIDRYIAPHPHFILSHLARGGFSGGPVISEYGFLLGVTTESLLGAEHVLETGFAAAISIEPLLVLLHDNRIYPGENGRIIRELLSATDDDAEPAK